MIELQLTEKQNFENLKYKKKLCGLCEIYRKNLQNQHNLREHILIFELPSSDFIQSQFRFLRFHQVLQKSIFHQVWLLKATFLEIQFHGFFLELNSTKSLLVSQ